MKRGDVVLVALRGDSGKPRPALVIQSDSVIDTGHILVCPMTSDVREEIVQRRIFVLPDPDNGLRQPSQIMIDKINIVRRDKCRDVIGSLKDEIMSEVDQAIAFVVGLFDNI